ncbi:MAG TPA: catalase [Geminicoccaceae bacterium]|nr:catalase [Geminicoccus sp.]HMU48871.1 catalase [Geminicoccaceae bacterium]
MAFCPRNIGPDIDFSDDALLQGRDFSCLDTRLKRLGSPNRRRGCPSHNFQCDSHLRMEDRRAGHR